MGLSALAQGSRAVGAIATIVSLCAACGARSGLREPEAPPGLPSFDRFDSGLDARDSGAVTRDAADVADVADAMDVADASDAGECPTIASPGGVRVPLCSDARCAGRVECRPCVGQTQSFALSSSADRPELRFAIDRSESMAYPTSGSSITRWQALRIGLAAVLTTNSNHLTIAGLLYPFNDQGNVEEMSCAVSASLNIAPSELGGVQLLQMVMDNEPLGATPTGRALRVMREQAMLRASASRRVFVLATDGEPNCREELPFVVALLERLRTELGIETFVLGIPGEDAATARALDQLAIAGGRPRAATPRFYLANTDREISRALGMIQSSAYGCALTARSALDTSPLLSVSLDGRLLDRDREWVFSSQDPRTVYIVGSACDEIGAGRARAAEVRWCSR